MGYEGLAVGKVVADVEVVHCPNWELGQAHSLRAVVQALNHRDVDALCVGLADQPLVGPESYRRLATAAKAGVRFGVSTYSGQRGNPVLIHRELWSDVDNLTGDEGARALMGEHEVTEIDCTGTGISTDVDTISELHRLEEEYHANLK